jgi:hypothetical protein
MLRLIHRGRAAYLYVTVCFGLFRLGLVVLVCFDFIPLVAVCNVNFRRERCYFMARNFPGPYAIEIKYSVTLREHSCMLNCVTIGDPAPGTPAASISLATKSAGSVLVQTAVDQFWLQFRKGLNGGSTNGIGWTLWKYAFESNDKTFISAGLITSPAGGNAAAVVPASYIMVSLRSANGSTMKVEVLDSMTSSQAQTNVIPNPAALSYAEAVSAYLLSAQGWVLARDDGYPIAALRQSHGQNETVWKKINRPN